MENTLLPLDCGLFLSEEVGIRGVEAGGWGVVLEQATEVAGVLAQCFLILS